MNALVRNIRGTRDERYSLPVFLIGLFLLAAPWWAPCAQELNGRNLFLQADSMVALGIGLLYSLLCQLVIPDQALHLISPALKWIRQNFKWLALLFLGGILAALILINRHVFHQFLNSADEHSCYFLAECIRLKRWFAEPHALSEFFNVVHVGNRDGKWFSVYPPGWPFLWAIGLDLGIHHLLNPVMTTLSLIFFYLAGKKVFGQTAAWLGLFLMSLSPFFLFTGASYFSHSTCLFLVSVFLYSYLKWREKAAVPEGVAWAALAAFAVGYGLNTRYLSMAVIAAPFLLFHLIRIALRKEPLRRAEIVFAVILVAMTSFVFIHNHLVTGDWSDPPNHYDKRWERLGFRGDYTPLDALIYITARFFYLMDWFPPILVVLFLASLFVKRDEGAYPRIFRWGFFTLVFGYALYYSWGGNQYGPRYYYEGLPFLALALGASLKGWWRTSSVTFRKFLIGALFFSLLNTGYVMHKQTQFFEPASAERKALYVLAEKRIQRPSIVFIKGFLGDRLVMSQDDAVRNHPSLEGKILYAKDIPGKNEKLMNYYPDRDYYMGSYDRSIKGPRLERIAKQ